MHNFSFTRVRSLSYSCVPFAPTGDQMIPFATLLNPPQKIIFQRHIVLCRRTSEIEIKADVMKRGTRKEMYGELCGHNMVNTWKVASVLFLLASAVMVAAMISNISTYYIEVIDVYETDTLAEYCADWGMGYRYEQCYQIEQDRYMILAGFLASLGLSVACYSASKRTLIDEFANSNDKE